MRILVNIILIIAAFATIYIAYYLLKTDLKNKQINAQLEEEKDDCKKNICEINKRVSALEKVVYEDRNNNRKDKTSSRNVK